MKQTEEVTYDLNKPRETTFLEQLNFSLSNIAVMDVSGWELVGAFVMSCPGLKQW